MKSCKGPGKSCILAILAWNFLLCYPQSIAGATSINAPNLCSNLWVELARWKAKAKGNLLEGMFETTTKEIRHREHPETWKLQARTWRADATPEQIGNALAGLHADYVAWFMDETGDYPEAILPTVEAIFAGNPKVARIVQAGNPTRLSGPLYVAVSKTRHLWKVIDITADPDDPRRTPRVSVEHAREQIGLYGRDNPWVLVNIFGQFPPSSLNALIGPEESQGGYGALLAAVPDRRRAEGVRCRRRPLRRRSIDHLLSARHSGFRVQDLSQSRFDAGSERSHARLERI